VDTITLISNSDVNNKASEQERNVQYSSCVGAWFGWRLGFKHLRVVLYLSPLRPRPSRQIEIGIVGTHSLWHCLDLEKEGRRNRIRSKPRIRRGRPTHECRDLGLRYRAKLKFWIYFHTNFFRKNNDYINQLKSLCMSHHTFYIEQAESVLASGLQTISNSSKIRFFAQRSSRPLRAFRERTASQDVESWLETGSKDG